MVERILVRSSGLACGTWLAPDRRMPGNKHFVYVLKNADPVPRFYVGLSSDASERLEDHNAGRCPHTARHRPWQLHSNVLSQLATWFQLSKRGFHHLQAVDSKRLKIVPKPSVRTCRDRLPVLDQNSAVNLTSECSRRALVLLGAPPIRRRCASINESD